MRSAAHIAIRDVLLEDQNRANVDTQIYGANHSLSHLAGDRPVREINFSLTRIVPGNLESGDNIKNAAKRSVTQLF